MLRDPNKTVVEGALRSILSLSYLDSIALWLTKTRVNSSSEKLI